MHPKRSILFVVLALGAISWLGVPAGVAQAPKLELPAARFLPVNFTFQVAEVPPAQIRQIVAEVEKSSFDHPASWEKELRVEREALGAAEVLIVRGTELLCGGTGNCQTWVFLHRQGRWVNLFPGQAPLASGLGFEQKSSLGIRNAVTVTALDAKKDRYTIWTFNGRAYRSAQCLLVEPFDTESDPKISKVPCQ
jgi:hypothetical protein